MRTGTARTLGGLLLLAPLLAAAGGEVAPERVVWEKVPVPVVLPVGVERRVELPAPVRVGLPPGLASVLRVQSIAGTLYLRAEAPFPAQRVLARETAGTGVYLLDVSAVAGEAPAHPLVIVHPAPAAPPEEQAPARDYDYVTLVRYAAQQLYAPARLHAALPGVVRVPVSAEPVPLVRGGEVTAAPLVAWRAGGLHVTAVQLTNRSPHAVTLDPRALRGRWLAATFQHHRLLPRGDEADTTAVYLVSARPFAESL